MKISILISTYNGENDIRNLLDSIKKLEKGSSEVEVILRDDSSSDNTVKIVEDEYKWVKLVRGKGGNLGFVKSNNILFNESTGHVVCCVNQDTILHQDFLLEGVNILDQHPEASGVNTNMIMPWIMSLERFRETKKEDLPAYEYQLTPYGFVQYVKVGKSVRKTNFMTGGGFFVRKSIIPEDGHLFDPFLDMYCEDTELSLRLQRHGGGIVYSPQSLIYHNQAPRKASTFREFVKLIRITRNRFSLFAAIDSYLVFTMKYPLYLLGIIKKMSYLGLPGRKVVLAQSAGVGVAFLFSLLFPYFFILSTRKSILHRLS